MVKSKTNEERVEAQEVAALKLDVELVSTRTEELGTKVDGVQQQVSKLFNFQLQLSHCIHYFTQNK